MTMPPVLDQITAAPLPFDGLAPWDAATQALEVISVIEEAPDVKTFVFRPEGGGWFRYKPGQFVTLVLPHPGGEVLRTYTLSSSPTRPFSASVTVKAQAGSTGTRWMLDHLQPGARLKAYGPGGTFTNADSPAERYLFLSAGSGITPMMSMLRAMSDTAPLSDVAFLTCARTPGDLIFRAELELLERQMPGLNVTFLVEGKAGRDLWHGPVGRLDPAKLTLLVPDFRKREIFCCGPEPFMAAVREQLEDRGFDMRRYHEESFGGTPAPAGEVPELLPEDSTEGFTVSFKGSDVTLRCAEGTTVLQAARASGVRIPAACESGLCGTCKVMKRKGEVTMEHNGGILDDEIEEGYILACCSRPLGDVEIEA